MISSISESLYLASLSTSLSVCPLVLIICLTVDLYVYLLVSLSVCLLYVSVAVCLSDWLYVIVADCLSLWMTDWLSARVYICLSICLYSHVCKLHLYVCAGVSVCLSVGLSVCWLIRVQCKCSRFKFNFGECWVICSQQINEKSHRINYSLQNKSNNKLLKLCTKKTLAKRANA